MKLELLHMDPKQPNGWPLERRRLLAMPTGDTQVLLPKSTLVGWNETGERLLLPERCRMSVTLGKDPLSARVSWSGAALNLWEPDAYANDPEWQLPEWLLSVSRSMLLKGEDARGVATLNPSTLLVVTLRPEAWRKHLVGKGWTLDDRGHVMGW